jgi:NifU-like protein involved in Fe-S cluster formation
LSTKDRAKQMIAEIFDELKDQPGSRIDKQNQGTKVKGYWCGSVLRFDVQFQEGTR